MFDRSKFKGSTLNDIKGEQERANKALPSLSSGGRAGFHTIEDGKNWRRIAPAHNNNDPAYRACSTVMLDCDVPEIDDNGVETGKREVKRKNIFIATQHSLTMKQDPVMLYIQYVQKRADDEIQDKDARQKFLYPINGWRSKDGKWNWGIKPSTDYVCYAWDSNGTLGRERLYPFMLDQMKKISVERADDNSEIIPDIFTDPDEGYPLIILRIKNDKGKMETSCSCDMPGKKESWAEFFLRTRVTDEQLAELMKKESLKELYEDVYTTRDFDMAIDGLQRFDKINKYNIFDNEEFVEKITVMRAQCPVYKPKNNEEVEPTDVEETKQDVKQQTPVTSQSSTVVPVPAMKRFLKEYIFENYGADYTLPELDKETLTEWYGLAKGGEELPFDAHQAEESRPTPPPIEQPKTEIKPEPKPVAPSPVATPEINAELAAQIAALRSRRANK